MAMTPSARGPRSLLRQIREAMAGGGPAQARLDMVVRIIARSMVAEVCSIYLRRANGDMELFATEGLSSTAVHVTTMKPGEGLIGEIMRQGRPLNLSDAPNPVDLTPSVVKRRLPSPLVDNYLAQQQQEQQ